MKKILLILLSFSAILLLTACGEIKYELKDGTMYANGKEAWNDNFKAFWSKRRWN